MTGHILAGLRPHQHEPVRRLVDILQRHQSAVDISDTGVGKTYVAAAVAKALQLPCLVVCPKIVVSAWHRAAAHFGDSLSVMNYESIRTGNTLYGTWEKPRKPKSIREELFICVCCQQKVDVQHWTSCYAHPLGVHCIAEKKSRQNLGRFEFHSAVKFVIFDEIHRCGAMKSLNAEMLIAAKRQNIKVLGLSATAACAPLQMRALGYNLDLHSDKYDWIAPTKYGPGLRRPSFYRWAARYGCRKIPPLPGIRWAVGAERQKTIMSEISSQIIPARGVRVRVSYIPDFPERSITAELYDVPKPEEIDNAYESIRTALQELHGRASLDKSSCHPLTEQLRARQKIELLKVPACVELAGDYIEKGFSIGIFINFRATLDELTERLPGAVRIFGGQNELERKAAIGLFQSDEVRVIVIMSDAGGVGLSLPDVSGNHPRGGLVMPHHSDKAMRQIFGRFHRADSVSNCWYKVLLAAGTVEERMYRNLNQKLANLDSLNDGDWRPA